jgi:prepilin-type N-terminal cleavage/methylation domain-containing protein
MPRSRTHQNRAFTLIELLVVIAIISILTALLLPAMGRARRQGRIIACASNMRQTYMAMQMYANDYHDHVWNYASGAHDHVSPDDGKTNHLMWYKNSSNAAFHAHLQSEGDCSNSFWRGILIERKYGHAAALGCSIPLDPQWDLSTGGNEIEPTNSESFRRTPPFVYHGRACGNDVRISVYAGGNIACTGWFYEVAGRETIHSPKPNKTRPEVLLHCPVWKKDIFFPTVDNAQWQPHQATGAPKYWSEFAGNGYLGHVTAENVCWNDGSVIFMDSGGRKFKYIHPETRGFGDSPIIP